MTQALIVLVIAACSVNLLLTFAVLRRLREHGDRLAKVESGSGSSPDLDSLVGREVESFTVTGVDGRPVTREGLIAGSALVGFFSEGCAPCHEQAPEFARLAASGELGHRRICAVIDGTAASEPGLAAVLAGIDVVIGSDAKLVEAAFGVRGYPTFVMLDDGVVSGAEPTVAVLAARTAV